MFCVSYQVFARKYRPRTFEDVLGQEHVVMTLRNAIMQNRLAHAWLFVGPRGTGKTSMARILSKALNATDGPKVDFDPDAILSREIAEGRCLDVIEIDGATHNKVDHIRDIVDQMQFAPSQAQFKIYYIDEVHMLTTGASNALLKTLEEPPSYVKFIFATTEPHKILPTIISRCQRFDLRPIPTEIIANHLQYIAQSEGVFIEESAAWAVAKGADGGMRDAQSMLDQLVSFCGEKIKEKDVLEVFGFTSRETVAKMLIALFERDIVTCLEGVTAEAQKGRNLSQLLGEMIACLRMLLIVHFDTHASTEGYSAELFASLKEAAKTLNVDGFLRLIGIFSETEISMKNAGNKALHFEMGLIKAMQSLQEASISDVIKTLKAIRYAGNKALVVEEEPSCQETSPQKEKKDAQKETVEQERAALPQALSRDSSKLKEPLKLKKPLDTSPLPQVTPPASEKAADALIKKASPQPSIEEKKQAPPQKAALQLQDTLAQESSPKNQPASPAMPQKATLTPPQPSSAESEQSVIFDLFGDDWGQDDRVEGEALIEQGEEKGDLLPASRNDSSALIPSYEKVKQPVKPEKKKVKTLEDYINEAPETPKEEPVDGNSQLVPDKESLRDEASDVEALSGEDFYEDSLIKEALRIFEGAITSRE